MTEDEKKAIYEYNKELAQKMRDARLAYAIEHGVPLKSVVVGGIEPMTEDGSKVRFRIGIAGVHSPEEIGGDVIANN